MPCLLLYYLGYEARLEWNNNALVANCNVTDHKIIDKQCPYSCNCIRTCTGSSNNQHCTTTCQTCYYTCFDGYIEVQYNDPYDNIYKNLVEICDSYRYYIDVYNKLNDYPLNNNIKCFYNHNNPNEVKIDLYNPVVYFVFFIIFAVLGTIVLIAWIIFEIINSNIKNHLENLINNLKFTFENKKNSFTYFS